MTADDFEDVFADMGRLLDTGDMDSDSEMPAFGGFETPPERSKSTSPFASPVLAPPQVTPAMSPSRLPSHPKPKASTPLSPTGRSQEAPSLRKVSQTPPRISRLLPAELEGEMDANELRKKLQRMRQELRAAQDQIARYQNQAKALEAMRESVKSLVMECVKAMEAASGSS